MQFLRALLTVVQILYHHPILSENNEKKTQIAFNTYSKVDTGYTIHDDKDVGISQSIEAEV